MVHWLQFDGIKCKPEIAELQLKELQGYLKENTSAKATGYLKFTGNMFAKFVRLEYQENYRDLNIECNAGDASLRHLNSKPSNIEYAEYLTQTINTFDNN